MQSFDGAVRNTTMTKTEEKLKQNSADRQEFCSNILQCMANMLDPKYCGSQLTDEISDLVSHTEGYDAVSCLCDLVEFRANKEGLWKSEGILQAVTAILTATWWKGLCAKWSLAPVARSLPLLLAVHLLRETGVHTIICIVPREIALLTFGHTS